MCAQVPPELVDPTPLLTASRVTIVAGKGGVGKTTVTAVLARAAADAGQRVLVVELDGKPVLRELVDGLDCEQISAPAALEDYLREHGFGRVAKRLSASGVIDVVATAAPGIDDIVVLGKIKQLERSGKWDVIVVDGPAAGHAITFLTSAAGLLGAVRGGPVRAQATDVAEMLGDPERSQVVLVTLPETTPVNEAVQTAYALEDRVGVKLGPVVVNNVDGLGAPARPRSRRRSTSRGEPSAAVLTAAADFRRARRAVQDAEIARLGEQLALEQWHLPMLPVAGLDAGDVAVLAGSLWRPRDRRRSCSTTSSTGAEVIVCCGSGGVGKTTTAAVIGLEAARPRPACRRRDDRPGPPPGRRARPPRRPRRRAAGDRPAGPAGSGELWAMMLDTASAFDGVVRRNAADSDQAERILANPFYRNISGALSGTQEYMAAETLNLLHDDERFDLVVVDTPPSRNALDFLEAPSVLARFLDHRLFRLLMLPARRGMRVVNAATQPMLRAIGKVVGSDVLADAVAFFQAFAGMEAGFRERAEAVMELLRSDVTRYVVVASPHRDTVTEAVWFAGKLADHGIEQRRRRRQPRAPGVRAGTAPRMPSPPRPSRPPPAVDDDLAALWTNLAELRALAAAAAAELAPLAELLGPLADVPLLAGDVHDLEGLGEIRRHLFGDRGLTGGSLAHRARAAGDGCDVDRRRGHGRHR